LNPFQNEEDQIKSYLLSCKVARAFNSMTGSEFLDLRYKGRRLFEVVYIDDFKLEVNERICSRYVEVGQLEEALVLFQARDFDGGLRALKFIFHG
jgi:hypothetical protein